VRRPLESRAGALRVFGRACPEIRGRVAAAAHLPRGGSARLTRRASGVQVRFADRVASPTSAGIIKLWWRCACPRFPPLRLRPPGMGGGRVGMAAARRRGAREGLPCCGRAASPPDPLTFARAFRRRRDAAAGASHRHRCACAAMFVAPTAGPALRTCHTRSRLRRFLSRPINHTAQALHHSPPADLDTRHTGAYR
jgi:hypothetical protein